MDVHVDVGDAIKELRKGFRELTGSQLRSAVSRAINHTITKTRTDASREIRQVYNIKAGALRRAFKIERSTALTMTAKLFASASSLPLMAFGARQTSRGASVAIKRGGRKVVRSGFIQTMPNGYTGVFGRGRYQTGQFQFRRRRIQPTGSDLPIVELKTVSAHIAMTNVVVMERLADKTNEAFTTRLVHELRRASGRS